MTEPDLREYRLLDDTGQTHTVQARLVGSASSADGRRSRWQEVDIYRDAFGLYLVATRGCTDVAGESTRHGLTRTTSPTAVVEHLTIVRAEDAFLPRPARLALAEAAQFDDRLREALLDRVVT